MVIKMVSEFKLAVVHLFCTPRPDPALCMHMDLLLDKKNCGKSGLGRRAIAGRGPQAAGPSKPPC